MSKKHPSAANETAESFDEAIERAAAVPVPAKAPAAPSAPATPEQDFFAGCRAHGNDQRPLAKLAKAHPEWALAVDPHGFNALTLALLTRKADLAAVLVEMGSDLNQASSAIGWRPLVVACGRSAGDDAMANLLLDKGADPSSKTHDGLYALISACTYGNLPLAQRLVKAGANPDPADATIPTIVAAAGSGNAELVDFLLSQGAKPTTTLGPRNDFSALHQAAKHGHPAVASLLLASGALIDAMANDGNTALHLAAAEGQPAAALALVQAGASLSLENRMGKIPAELAHGSELAAALAPAPGAERVKHPLLNKPSVFHIGDPAAAQAKKEAKAAAPKAKAASKKAAAPKKAKPAAKPAQKGSDAPSMSQLARTMAKAKSGIKAKKVAAKAPKKAPKP